MKNKQLIFGATIFFVALLTISCKHDDQIIQTSNIANIVASPATIIQGGTTQLIVVTQAQGTTGILWSSSDGELESPQNDTTNWKAPDSPGNYVISVIVTDDLGNSVGTVNVGVDVYVPAVSPH